MIDRIAPKCPLCEAIVPTPKSGEPNEAVELHITSGTCPGLEGGEARRKEELRRKKDRGEVCWRKGCSKTLIVQMKCLVSPSRPACCSPNLTDEALELRT